MLVFYFFLKIHAFKYIYIYTHIFCWSCTNDSQQIVKFIKQWMLLHHFFPFTIYSCCCCCRHCCCCCCCCCVVFNNHFHYVCNVSNSLCHCKYSYTYVCICDFVSWRILNSLAFEWKTKIVANASHRCRFSFNRLKNSL